MSSRVKLQTAKNDQLQQAKVIKWVNHQLLSAGYSDQVVTDIGVDIADGLTLIKLVQHITGQSIIHYHSSPLLRKQKIDNINTCLQLLQQYGWPVTEINVENIVAGDLETTLLFFQYLMHYDKTQSPTIKHGNDGKTRLITYENRELLNWVGEVVHQNVSDFSSFYDGHILCDLVNSVHHKAIDYNDLANLSPIQCLQVAFSAAETHLGISRGTIDLNKLACGQEDHKLKSYLQHFKMIHHHVAKRKLRNSLLGVEQEEYSRNSKDRTTARVPPRPKRATSEAHLSMTLPRDHGSIDARQSMSIEHLNSKTSSAVLGRTKQRENYSSSRSDHRISIGTQYPTRVNNAATLPRYSTTTVERSYSSDIPLPVTIYRTSSRSSIHSTSSRSSIDRSVDEHHLPLTNLANLSSPIVPSHLLPIDNEPDAPSEYNLLSTSMTLDQTFHLVMDMNDRLKEMLQSIDEEKNELEHKLLLAVKRERKQRETLEKKYEKLSKRASYITQHYDGCLVELAKQMAHIKDQMSNLQEQVSSIMCTRNEWATINSELKLLRQKIQQVEEGQTLFQSQQQPLSLDTHSSQLTSYNKHQPHSSDKTKKNLFSRKKS